MKKLLILEDDERRCEAMRECLRGRIHTIEAVFFDDAHEMCAYLQSNPYCAVIIALDHDLVMKPVPNGKSHDPGTGRDVASFLANQVPSCPVIIHSTNSAAADGMQFLLQDSGWETHRVYPWGDLEWISEKWIRTVRSIIRSRA
jgi:hypothetical protein